MAMGREGDTDALYAFESRGFGGEIGLGTFYFSVTSN